MTHSAGATGRTVLLLTGWAFAAMLGFDSSVAAAQDAATSCEGRARRPFVGAGIAVPALDARILFDVVPHGFDEEVVTRRGLGISAQGVIPVSSRYGVRVEADLSNLGVERNTLGGRNQAEVLRSVAAGSIRFSHLGIGFVNQSPFGRKFCGYAGATAGFYQFSYRGYVAKSAGIAGTVGFELPFPASRHGAFVEFQLDAANNRGKPPLNAELAFVLRAAAGARFRF